MNRRELLKSLAAIASVSLVNLTSIKPEDQYVNLTRKVCVFKVTDEQIVNGRMLEHAKNEIRRVFGECQYNTPVQFEAEYMCDRQYWLIAGHSYVLE